MGQIGMPQRIIEVKPEPVSPDSPEPAITPEPEPVPEPVPSGASTGEANENP